MYTSRDESTYNTSKFHGVKFGWARFKKSLLSETTSPTKQFARTKYHFYASSAKKTCARYKNRRSFLLKSCILQGNCAFALALYFSISHWTQWHMNGSKRQMLIAASSPHMCRPTGLKLKPIQEAPIIKLSDSEGLCVSDVPSVACPRKRTLLGTFAGVRDFNRNVGCITFRLSCSVILVSRCIRFRQYSSSPLGPASRPPSPPLSGLRYYW